MRAVYAGSFDPITLGHVSVIERAFQLFSEVHIIVANNRSKNIILRLSSVRSLSLYLCQRMIKSILFLMKALWLTI